MSQFAKIFESIKETPTEEKKNVVKVPKTKTNAKAEEKSEKEPKQSAPAKKDTAIGAPKLTEATQEQSVKTTAAPDKPIPEAANVLQTTPSPVKKAGKSSNQDYTQVLSYIRRDTHKLIKKALIDDPLNRDLSDLVEELLAEWIKKND